MLSNRIERNQASESNVYDSIGDKHGKGSSINDTEEYKINKLKWHERLITRKEI